MPIDWDKFSVGPTAQMPFVAEVIDQYRTSRFGGDRRFDGAPDAPLDDHHTVSSPQIDWRSRLHDTAPSERTTLLQRYLNEQIAQILGHPSTYELPLTQPWTELEAVLKLLG